MEIHPLENTKSQCSLLRSNSHVQFYKYYMEALYQYYSGGRIVGGICMIVSDVTFMM